LRIDAHQHFWQFDPVRDSWINDEMSVIRKDFLPENLEPILKENKIDGCVSVQADQSEVETLFLLKHAEDNAFMKGVVGWVDLRSPEIENRLDYFSQYNKLKGFRHIVQAEPDDEFLLRNDFCNGISLLHSRNYTYDILIYPKHLQAAIKFVNLFPNQAFAVDHLAKPFIKKKDINGWKKEISALAGSANVWCKLSGMVTEADWKNWREGDFKPFLDVVFDAFGTNRLMYGSDWPVCLVASTYKSQLSIVENYIASFSESERSDIMGNNAVRFYNL
jgi:L-fuconolactonase